MSRASDIREAQKRFREYRYAGFNQVMEDQDIILDAARDYADLLDQLSTQTRSVMGQDEDGTPNGQDYTESRLVTDWVRAEE